jgi:hypothetical protein
VHEGSFEEVVIDLVEVFDGADDLCADVLPVVEGFQVAPYPAVCVVDELRLLGAGIVEEIRVYVFFDFDTAGAVVDLVGDVSRLAGDVADLADECEL